MISCLELIPIHDIMSTRVLCSPLPASEPVVVEEVLALEVQPLPEPQGQALRHLQGLAVQRRPQLDAHGAALGPQQRPGDRRAPRAAAEVQKAAAARVHVQNERREGGEEDLKAGNVAENAGKSRSFKDFHRFFFDFR